MLKYLHSTNNGRTDHASTAHASVTEFQSHEQTNKFLASNSTLCRSTTTAKCSLQQEPILVEVADVPQLFRNSMVLDTGNTNDTD
jgi:hypothetical protein